MRRRTILLGSVAGVLGLTGLSACSTSTPQAPGSSGTDESAGTGAGADARTIEHRYGATKITGVPQRVVSVGITEQDYLLALGIAPVGVREWFGGFDGALAPWAREKLGDQELPTVLPAAGLAPEQVAALRPDLILGINSGLTQEEYDTLSKIAPIIAQPSDVDYGATWQELTLTTGAALGRTEEAEAMVADVEAQLEDAKSQLPADRTALLAAVIDDGFQVYSDGPAPQFLQSLGLSIPEGAAAAITAIGGEAAPVSAERTELLEADALVLGLYGIEAAALAQQPTYAALDVVKEDRVVTMTELSRTNVAITFATVLSLPIAIEEMVPRLSAALDGDPGTAPAPTATLKDEIP